MPASTTSARSRVYTLHAALARTADEEDRFRLRTMLEAFLDAIDLGFFDDSPDLPASIEPSSVTWQTQDFALLVRFSAAQLPRASFVILAGMLTGYAEHLGLPVEAAKATLGDSGDLLTTDAPPFRPLVALPFEHEVPRDGPDHKALRIWLDFVEPISDPLGEQLTALFRVWDALVLGPFPAEGRHVGDSWAGPSHIAFLLPTRIEYANEDFESGPGAVDVLLRALLRVHRRYPIDRLEIE